MITLSDYWMGRDIKYASECTDEIKANAQRTVDKVNELITIAESLDGIVIDTVASGWRPKSVNDKTQNAGKSSKHISALAVDLKDTANRALAKWCIMNQPELVRIGLWMEDPRWTPTWVHFQIVPPASWNRIYIPSTKPPLTNPLPGQV